MALEDVLKENTDALNRLTAALLKGKPAGAADAAVAAEAARVAAAGKKPAATKPPAGPTLDTIKARFGAYLGAEDPTERKARIANVQEMMNNFGVERATLLAKEQWAEALGYLDQLEAGETPEYGGGDGGGGEASLI